MDTQPVQLYSSPSSPYQLLIGHVFWNRMTRLVLFTRSILDKDRRKKDTMWALLALKIRWCIFNGHCCDSKASSSQFCVLIQVLLCKFSRTFLHQSSYSMCPWICCDSNVPAGETLHKRSSWLSHLALYWFLFLVICCWGFFLVFFFIFR